MVAPAVVGLSVKREVPLWPVVEVGFPPQNSMVPAMPPQMERMATFVECVFRAAVGSRQVVPVTSAPVTTWSPRVRRAMEPWFMDTGAAAVRDESVAVEGSMRLRKRA